MEKRPQLSGLELIAYEDFQRLESQRPIGGMGGVGQIPVLDMHRYLDVHETEPADRTLLIALWQEMDSAVLSHYAKKSQEKTANVGKESGRNRAQGGRREVPRAEYPEG